MMASWRHGIRVWRNAVRTKCTEMSKMNSGVTGPNHTKFLHNVGKFNAHLTCHRCSDVLIYFGIKVRQMKVGMPKMPILPQKFVAMALSLEQSQNE